MALFSDMDWLILLVAGAFLLFGKENTEVLRTLGRWYGRAGRLKQELLSEFTRAAELPMPPGGNLSIRGALLGLDPAPSPAGGIPAAVTRPPASLSPVPPPSGPSPWTGGYPVPTWSMTVPAAAYEAEVSR
jgi:hypothetical protein